MADKKQKVLIVHNYYQIPGGEDTVVANEKKMLEDHGHEVMLYTRQNAELKTLSKAKKLLLPFATVFNFRTYKEVKRLIKKEKVEVVHVHNTLNMISPSVYYAAFACKVPIVQTVHNFRLICPGATLFRDGHICEDCLEKGLLCAVKHQCYRGSRLQTLACVISTWIHRVIGTYGRLNYICLTDFNKEKLLSLQQIREEKVFVKPNFVENTECVIPYDRRKNQLVYAGRLDRLKGIDLLLEAWKKVQEEGAHLVICGVGPLEEWCREYAESRRLQNIEFRGFVDNQEVRKIMAESKALILPTQWYEGFPMTILEAYSTGTPVVVSDLGNAGSLIEEGKSGWKFQADSTEDLSRALLKAINSGHGILAEFTEKYSRENNYEQLRKIYEACCDHH